jgi:hypothetical protein
MALGGGRRPHRLRCPRSAPRPDPGPAAVDHRRRRRASPGWFGAFELEQRGHRVTVLEADARPIGGRVRTLRFADGRYGEAGAMRIPDAPRPDRRYPARFRRADPALRALRIRRAWYFARGRRVRIADARADAALSLDADRGGRRIAGRFLGCVGDQGRERR